MQQPGRLKTDFKFKDRELAQIQHHWNRPPTLTVRGPGTEAFTHASSLLQNTWIKRERFTFDRLFEVKEIDNPRLTNRYNAYKSTLPDDGNESLVFHGCEPEALQKICADGFLAEFQKSSTGSWQRFGPGFYFALQASKSHEYPLERMDSLPVGGPQTREMLLCKVAAGTMHVTKNDVPQLTGPPAGCHSVHGIATRDGSLNYDELVVYQEAAVLPYAVVTYMFHKVTQ